MAQRLPGHATRADLEALPPGVKGEIIDGVLYTMPRPRPRHAHAVSVLDDEIFAPFHRGRGGPGGWWILDEPGIELPDAPEVAPDLAGWRRTRLPSLPADETIRMAPDWVCEVLSPSSRSYDRRVKLPFYARVGVGHAWIVDPDARTLEVKRLESGRWFDLAVFAGDEPVRAEPFESVEIALGALWLEPASET
jgi:Uma2 family endonuclease